MLHLLLLFLYLLLFLPLIRLLLLFLLLLLALLLLLLLPRSSSTSTEEHTSKSKKKSIIKTSKSTKRSESQPGRVGRGESAEGRRSGGGGGEGYRRCKVVGEHQYYPHLHPPHPIYTVHPPAPLLHHAPSKKGTVGRSYLSKLAQLPFLPSRQPQLAQVYGASSLGGYTEQEQARAFYL